jgi:hypothetical protein
MRALFIFALIILSSHSFAQVRAPYFSKCQFSVYFDSYGRGLEAAITGEDLRHRYNDETCYQMGIKEALNALIGQRTTRCNTDFENGHKEGLSISSNGAGGVCFNLGYTAGKALVGVSAREGNSETVGVDCVEAYQKGRQDGHARRSSRSSGDSLKAYCYQLGLYEATLLN